MFRSDSDTTLNQANSAGPYESVHRILMIDNTTKQGGKRSSAYDALP